MLDSVRYRDVSRLEGFSDCVFGFALTLLVVSLEVPRDATALRNLAGSFVPFALMFAMVTWIWYQHNVFFRRYGLQDPWTVFLNSILLFVVLFYVYPLKFLTLALVGPAFMSPDQLPRFAGARGPMVMVLYSAGVFLIFAVFALLHRHAWKRRRELELTELDEVTLRFSTRSHLVSMGLAVASLLLIWALPTIPAVAGLIYILMGPLHGWNGYMEGKARAAVEALPPPPEDPSADA